MADNEITGAQTTPAEPGKRVLILTVAEEDVPAVLAAAKLIAPDEDVAGYMGVGAAMEAISGTQCHITGFLSHDFECGDSDVNVN